MKFNVKWLCALLLGSLLVDAAAAQPAAQSAAPAPRAELEAAWDDFQQALAECTRFVREHPFYQNEEDRAAAYAYLSAMTLARIGSRFSACSTTASARAVTTPTSAT